MPTRPGSSIQTGPRSLMAKNKAPLWTGKELTNQRQAISIDALPDDILLPIFASYLQQFSKPRQTTPAWQSLVHVCRRWRVIVFGSPRRLDLRLFCTERTRSRDMLDIWPALPLVIYSYGLPSTRNLFNGLGSTRSLNNVVAALKCSDRVCQIILMISRVLEWKSYLAAMKQPFPELTMLRIILSEDGFRVTNTVVPDSFLGRFAPRLELLELHGILFPGLPKLLLSATRLVELRLYNIPHSGYISPDAMVAALSNLTSLEYLSLYFTSPESCPDLETRRPPPLTRSVLPTLKYFAFKGASEYLEDLLTDIDALQLNKLEITFFNDILLDTPQLIQFISRTPISSALEKLENAHIALKDDNARVIFRPHNYASGFVLYVSIICEGLDWQLSSLEQVCTSCLPFLSTLKDVYIHEHPKWQPDWEDKIENRVWLELLHSFITMKDLYISKSIAPHIGPALQEGRTTNVLPTLENIFLEGLESSGPVQKEIGQFLAARQISGHPVTISHWENSEKDKNYG